MRYRPNKSRLLLLIILTLCLPALAQQQHGGGGAPSNTAGGVATAPATTATSKVTVFWIASTSSNAENPMNYKLYYEGVGFADSGKVNAGTALNAEISPLTVNRRYKIWATSIDKNGLESPASVPILYDVPQANPIVNPTFYSALGGKPFKILSADLLKNSFDPAGGKLKIVKLIAPNVPQAKVRLSGNYVIYYAPKYATNDFFSFVVKSSASSLTSTGRVNVTVLPLATKSTVTTIASVARPQSTPTASMSSLLSAPAATVISGDPSVPVAPVLKPLPRLSTNETMLFEVNGVAGQSFQVQATSDSSATNWVTIGNVTLDQDGKAKFEDAEAASFDSRYYRALPQRSDK